MTHKHIKNKQVCMFVFTYLEDFKPGSWSVDSLMTGESKSLISLAEAIDDITVWKKTQGVSKWQSNEPGYPIAVC